MDVRQINISKNLEKYYNYIYLINMLARDEENHSQTKAQYLRTYTVK